METPDAQTRWGLDIFGPLPEKRNRNKYIVVAVDHGSRFAHAKAVRSQSADQVLEFLDEIISLFGPPEAIITDRVDLLLQSFGVSHRTTSAAHLQTNGIVERFSGTLQNIIIKISLMPTQWDTKLNEALRSYRWRKNAKHGVSRLDLSLDLWVFQKGT